MQKALKPVSQRAVEGNNWSKFTKPKVSRGKTAVPSSPSLQARLGTRYDYEGIVLKDGVEFHKYNVQPNAGNDVPAAIKNWRDKNGGTHAVMSTVLVRKDGTKDDVKKALETAHKNVTG